MKIFTRKRVTLNNEPSRTSNGRAEEPADIASGADGEAAGDVDVTDSVNTVDSGDEVASS